MDKDLNYITEERKKELEQELADLKGPKRKELLDQLAYAKSLGDLKENAEYHQAREDQGKLEYRIGQIEEILKSSEVVSGKPKNNSMVGIGSTVVLIKDGDSKGDKKTYIIVGSEEVDMALGKISNHSSLGSELFNKKKGDTVSFKTPAGLVKYKIIEIS